VKHDRMTTRAGVKGRSELPSLREWDRSSRRSSKRCRVGRARLYETETIAGNRDRRDRMVAGRLRTTRCTLWRPHSQSRVAEQHDLSASRAFCRPLATTAATVDDAGFFIERYYSCPMKLPGSVREAVRASERRVHFRHGSGTHACAFGG